jgi:predicted metal-dependent hydrolase
MRIVDYIVVHEMIHLDELNHAPEFWRRMYQVLPDFPAHKRWLAEHGVELGV